MIVPIIQVLNQIVSTFHFIDTKSRPGVFYNIDNSKKVHS